MNTIETIMTRTSVRRFLPREVPEEALTAILKAGMSGPSCVNARDWSFVVVRDRTTLAQMAEGNGPPADPLRGAAFGVLVCGDLSRAFPPAKDYWIIDCSIAAQNMILAARELGIGSVWLGTWPQMERVRAQTALFGLPEDQIPHSLLAFGYPDETPEIKAPDWEADRVHYEAW